jgi:hypothetical protein
MATPAIVPEAANPLFLFAAEPQRLLASLLSLRPCASTTPRPDWDRACAMADAAATDVTIYAE